MKRITTVHVATAALLTMALGGLPAVQQSASAATFVPNTVPHYYGPYANYANSQLRHGRRGHRVPGRRWQRARPWPRSTPTTGAITALRPHRWRQRLHLRPTVDHHQRGRRRDRRHRTGHHRHGRRPPSSLTDGGTRLHRTSRRSRSSATAAAPRPLRVMAGYVGEIVIGLAGDGYVDPVAEIEQPDRPERRPGHRHGDRRQRLDHRRRRRRPRQRLHDRARRLHRRPGQRRLDGRRSGTRRDGHDQRASRSTPPARATPLATVVIPAPRVPRDTGQSPPPRSAEPSSRRARRRGQRLRHPGRYQEVRRHPPRRSARPTRTTSASTSRWPCPTPPPTRARDYYEIGVVQYREQMHRDLPPTLLRGYVQRRPPCSWTGQAARRAHQRQPRRRPPSSSPCCNDQQVYGVDNPHQYGPFIRRPRTVRSGCCSATCCPPAWRATCSSRSTRP